MICLIFLFSYMRCIILLNGSSSVEPGNAVVEGAPHFTATVVAEIGTGSSGAYLAPPYGQLSLAKSMGNTEFEAI